MQVKQIINSIHSKLMQLIIYLFTLSLQLETAQAWLWCILLMKNPSENVLCFWVFLKFITLFSSSVFWNPKEWAT